VERKLSHPFMAWMQDRVVTGRAIRMTLELLREAEAKREKVLVFGGWVQLHAAAQTLREAGERLRLAPGSIFGTGGGLKELYPYTPSQIRPGCWPSLIPLAAGTSSPPFSGQPTG
jgi:hypothetical protein